MNLKAVLEQRRNDQHGWRAAEEDPRKEEWA